MIAPRHVIVGKITLGNDLPMMLIAGPCALESRDHALRVAESLKKITGRLGIGLIFKTSFDKANRTRSDSPRGAGLEVAMRVFPEIRRDLGIPVLTDVHLPEQCAVLAEFVDVLQIPAYLCRQTDLLEAAARTGLTVNVKKGQFLAPGDMANVAGKVAAAGNENILLTERGTTFGYNALVSDFRSLSILAETGYPVVFDATHSVQQPGGLGGKSGGERQFVPALSRAAAAVGCAALFVETHPDPNSAPSDGPNMIPLNEIEVLIARLMAFDGLAKGAG